MNDETNEKILSIMQSQMGCCNESFKEELDYIYNYGINSGSAHWTWYDNCIEFMKTVCEVGIEIYDLIHKDDFQDNDDFISLIYHAFTPDDDNANGGVIAQKLAEIIITQAVEYFFTKE